MPKLPRPEGHHTVTPSFIVPNAARVREFLETAFGATTIECYEAPGGGIAHCESRLGDSVVMFGDATPSHGPMPASLAYYVDEASAVDTTYKRALDAGATSLAEPGDQFYGIRSATIEDPGGNRWTICAVIEQLSKEETERRMAEVMGGK